MVVKAKFHAIEIFLQEVARKENDGAIPQIIPVVMAPPFDARQLRLRLR